jgi:hypothetical protein
MACQACMSHACQACIRFSFLKHYLCVCIYEVKRIAHKHQIHFVKYIHMRIHTHGARARTHTHTHARTHTNIHVHMRTYSDGFTQNNIYIYIHTYVRAHTHTHTCTHTHICCRDVHKISPRPRRQERVAQVQMYTFKIIHMVTGTQANKFQCILVGCDLRSTL